MTLGEFIKQFSTTNNLIRLVYKHDFGYEPICGLWSEVCMDHEVLAQKGCFRHFVNNNVIGIVSVYISGSSYPEAINIIIERLENQPKLPDLTIHPLDGCSTTV